MEPAPDEQVMTTFDPADAAPTPGPEATLPPPTALESLVNALLEAGPDVAEHVVRAAQELLLAAQAVVEAAERAVEEQRDQRAEAAGPDATVHPIDRNE
jgi:hypothetical protein